MHPHRAANVGGRDVVQRRHRRIAGGRDVEREIRAQCLVEWIVERRLRATSRGGRSASTRSPWSGGTGQTNRVPAGQRDDFEAIAVIEIAPQDRAHRIQTLRPPAAAQHESTSLLLPREVEADKQDISMPAVGQRTEGLEPPGFLDRTLRFQIEREVAGATNELDITDRAVAMNQEPELRLQWRRLKGSLPTTRDLDHDVVGVFWKWKRNPFGRDGKRIIPCRRPLSRQRLRGRRRARRGLAMRLIARGRRRRSRDRVLRTLCRGSRSGLFLGWALERFGRLPRLHVGGWRGDQMDAIGRRKTRVARGCAE